MTQKLLCFFLLAPAACHSQMDHTSTSKPAAARSTTLTITGLAGATRTLTPAEFAALPHTTVHVHNAHSNADESYSGVPVQTLLALAKDTSTPKGSTNVQVVVASATDGFHVVLTLCDTNPECRVGESIVADAADGKAIDKDGAFKLILTEDKKPVAGHATCNHSP